MWTVACGSASRWESYPVPPSFPFPVYLEHGFRAEEPVTDYKIPQLETYVAPEGRDQILWLEPGGIRHQYRYDPLGRLTELNKTKAP